MEEIFAKSDFITVHVPLTPETQGLINKAAFAVMKAGVRILNCARGGIVDEQDLVDAIKEGKVAGAALDVYVEEPPPADHPLLQLDQVITTPHLGASTDEAQPNVAIAVAEQMVDFLTKGVVRYAVNVPSVSPELLAVLRPYLTLGEKLGSLHTQMGGALPDEVHVEYRGDVTQYNVAPLTVAVLKGLLSPVLESAVNYVNAPLMAKERGIKIVESIGEQAGDFASSITIKAKNGKESLEIEGAIFGAKYPRIVRVNNFYLEAVPEGYILILQNRDVPGVVGAVGTILGNNGINIAGMELGRSEKGGNAISFTHVDEFVTKKAGTQLHVFAENYIDSMKKQYATDPMPILHELNGPAPRLMTQPFFITIPERKDAEGKAQPAVKMVTMYGFAEFDDQKVLLISAALTSPSTNDNVHFLKLVEEMTESIKVVGKK